MMGPFSLYQCLVPLFALLMIAKSISRFLRHQQTIRELIAWMFLWMGISLVSLFPETSITWFARITGIKSGINALIFFALVILSYAVLHLFMKLEHNEKALTELVRKQALKDMETRRKK